MTIYQLNMFSREMRKLNSKSEKVSPEEARKRTRKLSAKMLERQREAIRKIREQHTGSSEKRHF